MVKLAGLRIRKPSKVEVLMRETILKQWGRYTLVMVGLAAALSCSSEGVTVPDPAIITLEVSAPVLSITPGESAIVTVNVTRTGDFTGNVHLSVSGAPAGVTGSLSNIETRGAVTSAILTIAVAAATRPGTYTLRVHGTGNLVVPAAADISLTVLQVITPCPLIGVCEQWAAEATASSEYTRNEWSAFQATGLPDVLSCVDDPNAWASVEPNGIEWLELTYGTSVRPTEIQVHESYGVSSIVKVEVGDGAGTYHTVYTALAGRVTCPRTLTIPVTGITTAMRVVRVSLDQRALQEWNEIDAVKLIGNR